MIQDDINAGTRRRLLIAAPGAVALVLATREQGRAKSSLAKFRKRRKAREKQAALDSMSTELEQLADPIATVRAYGEALADIAGGSDIGPELLASADALENHRSRLLENLAIARGETT